MDRSFYPALVTLYGEITDTALSFVRSPDSKDL